MQELPLGFIRQPELKRLGVHPSASEIQETNQEEQHRVPRRSPGYLGHLWLEL
jgi:hypothetical protein